MLRPAVFLLLAVVGVASLAPAAARGSAAAVAAAPRRRTLLGQLPCTGTGGAGCLELQPSYPVPLPTDQLTLVAAMLAELAYPDTVGGDCSGDCGPLRPQWEANVTAVATRMGATNARFLYGNTTSTQAFLLQAGNKAIVAFRGTEDGVDVRINLAATLTSLELGPRYNASSGAPPLVHAGFLAAASEIYGQVAAALRELDPTGRLPVFIVGHSLGGALASLNAALLQSAESPANHVAGVYTFGSPRVGDESWAAAYERLGLATVTLRVVNGRDVVPLVPAPAAAGSSSFTHVGQLVFITEGNRTFLGPASPEGTCANDTCGAWDDCQASQADAALTCSGLDSSVLKICDGNGLLGNLLDAFSDFHEDGLGRLFCPLLDNGLSYPPLCCALNTLWAMGKRTAADLLPSWLGGPEGEVESPVALVLRFHSSSSYVQRVAEDIAFANDTSFRYTRSVPSGAARRALSLAGAPLLLGAAAAGLAELLA